MIAMRISRNLNMDMRMNLILTFNALVLADNR
jgi:hypothetical protein